MAKDQFTRQWITDNSLQVINRYQAGMLTLRALHYQLVARGMTNSIQHYKRVVSAMIKARWDGLVPFYTFSDHDREVLGITKYEETILEDKVEEGKKQVGLWMRAYSKNRWENQPIYPEVWIEKKALQGVFQRPCNRHDVSLSPCKGYPSLTFLYEAAQRFRKADSQGKECVILYFGDYDPSGEDIPRSIEDNLYKMGVNIEVKRISLLHDQVVEWDLPFAPAKRGDSRTANWDGLGQVELDAVDIDKLMEMCSDAIEDVFDEDLYSELEEQEEKERKKYIKKLKKHVKSL